MSCPFCVGVIPYMESDLSYAKYDLFPVSKGHTLVIPRRHFSSYFESTAEEKADLWQLVDDVKNEIQINFSPDGFNVGINVGEAAGQTVLHSHIHIIPRYQSDVTDPTGGVRGVIPSEQKYSLL